MDSMFKQRLNNTFTPQQNSNAPAFGSNLPISYGGAYVPQYTASSPVSSTIVDPFAPKNDPIKSVENYSQRLQNAGMEVPERKSPGLGNMLMKAFDTMQRGQYAVTNSILETQNPDKYAGGIGDAIMRGLKGEQRSSTTDVFEEMGWKNDPTKKWHEGGNLARNVIGFAGDIALDPLTYVGANTLKFGAGAAKKAGKTAIKEMGEKVALNSVDNLASKLAYTLSTSTDDIMKRAAKYGDGANLVMDSAFRIGNGNIDETARILDKGFDALDPDTMKRYLKEMRVEVNQADEVVNKLAHSRRGGYINELGGSEVFGSKSPLNVGDLNFDTQRSFVENLDHALGSSHVFESKDARKAVLKKIFHADEVGESLLRTYSDRDLRILDAMYDAFGDTFDKAGMTKAEEIAQAFKKSRHVDGGEFKSMDELLSRFRKEAEARVVRDGKFEGVQFANGLQHVRDVATKSYHVRFMGKDLFDFTNTVGKGIGHVVDGAMKITPVRRTADALGYLFKPEHISQAVKMGNPQQYKAMQQVAEEISYYISRETGMPQESLKAVVNAFNPEFASNKKLRAAAVDYVERLLDSPKAKHAYAADAWEKTAKTLSPEELQLVKEAVATNAILNEAYLLWDKSHDVGMLKELGEKLLDPETYVKHLYDEDPDKLRQIYASMSKSDMEKQAFRLKAGHDYSRTFRTMAEAEGRSRGALTAHKDLLASSAVRYLDSMRVGLNKEMQGTLLSMVKEFPELKGAISKTNAPGLKKVANMNLYVDAEIMHQMKRVMDLPMNNQGAKYFMDVFDQFTNTMKTLQTSASPAFLMRNLIGETLMNWFAGVKIGSHTKAAEILKDASEKSVSRIGDTILLNGEPLIRRTADGFVEYGAKYGGALGGDVGKKWGNPTMLEGTPLKFEDMVMDKLKEIGIKTYTVGGQEMTANEIMKLFGDHGLTWSGVTKGNLIRNMDDAIKNDIAKKGAVNPVKRVLNFNQEVGDFTETWTRLAQMIDRMDNGYGVAEAVADVKKFHVDYRSLTTTEKEVFRRIAPYYTFMRKNTPIQLRLLLTEPGKVNSIFHLVRSSTEALKRDRGGEELATPDYLKEGLALPLYTDDDGNTRYLNWNLPLTDIGRLNFNLAEMAKGSTIDMMHPFLKMPFELAAGKNLNFGNEIQQYEGQRAPLLPGWEGSPRIVPKKADYLFQQMGFAEVLRRTLGQEVSKRYDAPEERNPYKPDQIPLIQSFLPLRNEQYTKWQHAYDHRDQLQDKFRFLKEEEGIELPRLPTGGTSYKPKLLKVNTPRKR